MDEKRLRILLNNAVVLLADNYGDDPEASFREYAQNNIGMTDEEWESLFKEED